MTPPDHHRMDTFSNRLTLLRILLVAPVVWGLLDSTPWKNLLSVGVFIIAAITDYFDGYYARAEKSITVLGQLLDPVADKILVTSSLIMLIGLQRLHPIPVILILAREFAISGLRSVASAQGIVISASRLAKWKTVSQMIGLPLLMADSALWELPLGKLGQGFIYLSLILSFWSFRDYFVAFFDHRTNS